MSRNDDGAILVTRPDDERRNRSLHGLSRTLIANLVTGVTEGYTTKMEIFGVGYRVQAKGRNLEFARLQPPGADHPPEGVTFCGGDADEVPGPGIDKRQGRPDPRSSVACGRTTLQGQGASATRVAIRRRSERQVSKPWHHRNCQNTSGRPVRLPPGRARHARLRKKVVRHRRAPARWSTAPRGTSTSSSSTT